MFSRIKVLLCLLLLTLVSFAGASTPPDLNSPHDVGAFMETYYLQPRPDLIAGVIQSLHPAGFLRPTNVPVVIGFFSEIFAVNSDRLPYWQGLIGKQDEQTRAALDRAFTVCKAGGVLKLSGHSGELNDEYWAAFFASGNPEYIKKLLDQLRYDDVRDDRDLFMAGASAKWSLVSNARSKPAVRQAIEKAKSSADKRTQEIIFELLFKDPARIQEETREVYREQTALGRWR